jgi:hypothetical protein
MLLYQLLMTPNPQIDKSAGIWAGRREKGALASALRYLWPALRGLGQQIVRDDDMPRAPDDSNRGGHTTARDAGRPASGERAGSYRLDGLKARFGTDLDS